MCVAALQVHGRGAVRLRCEDRPPARALPHAERHIAGRRSRSPGRDNATSLHSIKQVATWAKLNGGMIKMFEAEVTAAAPSAPGRKASACWRALLCCAFAVERTSRHAPCRCCSSSPSFSTFCSGACCRRLTGRRSSCSLPKLSSSLGRCIIFVKLTRAAVLHAHARKRGNNSLPDLLYRCRCCEASAAPAASTARFYAPLKLRPGATTVSSSPQSRRTRAGRSRSCTRFWA
jgi:hypothetical protein